MSVPEPIHAVYQSARCLFNHKEVEAALDTMAKEIHDELAQSNPLFLCVMVGGLIPAGQLLTRMDFPMELDYLHVTRYQGKVSGGILDWKNKPTVSLKGRIVLVLDDILDAGLTLKAIVDYCYEAGAKKVYTAVLVEKNGARLPEGLAKADFTGLVVDNYYVFGYGMDYKKYLRNAPGIFAVAEEFL